MSDRCIYCGHRYGYCQCPRPQDRHWPPDGVLDIGPRKHEAKPVQFNKSRVKP